MSDDQDGLVTSLNETIRDILWGTGPATARTLHGVDLHPQPARIVGAYTAGFRSEDQLRNAAYAKPGTTFDLFDLIEPTAWRQTRIYREFARPFGVVALLYARGDPYTSIAQTLQLSGAIYRKLDVGNKAKLARRLRIADDAP